MCRLASFPKNFNRLEALDILLEFEKNNTDGFGYTYLDENNQFVTKKWALSLSTLLKRKYPILSHMPHSLGWTICHLRAASCGIVRKENSHPFEVSGKEGDWAICHNGHFGDHRLLRLAMGSFLDFQGDTDSEVSANLIANIGPKKFSENIDSGGVYLCLKRDGTLFAIKTTYMGDLKASDLENRQFVLASTLDYKKYHKQTEMSRGWAQFNKNGEYITSKKKEYNDFSRMGYSGAQVYHNNLPMHYQGDYMGD
jgi:predicted glutamine amidotransferase